MTLLRLTLLSPRRRPQRRHLRYLWTVTRVFLSTPCRLCPPLDYLLICCSLWCQPAEIYSASPSHRRECTYYIAVGYYKLRNYTYARKFNGTCSLSPSLPILLLTPRNRLLDAEGLRGSFQLPVRLCKLTCRPPPRRRAREHAGPVSAPAH